MAENNETLKGSTMKVFGSVRQTILDRISWYSLFLSIDSFATGKIPKHSTELLLYETFRLCETKKFRRKILTLTPSLLAVNFFANRKFLEHSTEWLLYEMFRYCEAKKFRRKIVT